MKLKVFWLFFVVVLIALLYYFIYPFLMFHLQLEQEERDVAQSLKKIENSTLSKFVDWSEVYEHDHSILIVRFEDCQSGIIDNNTKAIAKNSAKKFTLFIRDNEFDEIRYIFSGDNINKDSIVFIPSLDLF